MGSGPKIDLQALEENLAAMERDKGPALFAPGEGGAAIAAETELSAKLPPPANGHAELPSPVPALGRDASLKMMALCEAAAADIRKLGTLAAEAGKKVEQECEQMAKDVLSNGEVISSHLVGFSQLLAEVGIRNRDTHKRLMTGSVSQEAIAEAAPQAEAGTA